MVVTQMNTRAMPIFEYILYFSGRLSLSLNSIKYFLSNRDYRKYGTKREVGSVWGTSVTVPVTISTSYLSNKEGSSM